MEHSEGEQEIVKLGFWNYQKRSPKFTILKIYFYLNFEASKQLHEFTNSDGLSQIYNLQF